MEHETNNQHLRRLLLRARQQEQHGRADHGIESAMEGVRACTARQPPSDLVPRSVQPCERDPREHH